MKGQAPNRHWTVFVSSYYIVWILTLFVFPPNIDNGFENLKSWDRQSCVNGRNQNEKTIQPTKQPIGKREIYLPMMLWNATRF